MSQRDGMSTLVQADWDDVDAAVRVAAPRVEMALLAASKDDGDPQRKVFALLTLADETLELDARLTDAGIELSTRVLTPAGPGVSSRERALRDAVARRLRELAGRDWAPVSPP